VQIKLISWDDLKYAACGARRTAHLRGQCVDFAVQVLAEPQQVTFQGAGFVAVHGEVSPGPVPGSALIGLKQAPRRIFE